MGAEEVLQRVADELEIRNLLARLAQLADGGDLDEYVSLFAEDAVWEGFGPARRGRADILAGATARRASGVQGPGTHNYHVVSNIAVFVSGDTAKTKSNFALFGNVDGDNPELRKMGTYRDEFRRTPQGWKLSHRMIGDSTAT